MMPATKLGQAMAYRSTEKEGKTKGFGSTVNKLQEREKSKKTKILAMVLLDQEELALVKATKPDDWQSRIGGAIISSAVVGAGVGAIEAFWTDVPAVKKEAAG